MDSGFIGFCEGFAFNIMGVAGAYLRKDEDAVKGAWLGAFAEIVVGIVIVLTVFLG